MLHVKVACTVYVTSKVFIIMHFKNHWQILSERYQLWCCPY